ncbi:MAG TPA: HAD-IA family hydrolase [Virgibacillus sp.]|nr:HAD-IA family hydrolase [Virgibacillus sp.]
MVECVINHQETYNIDGILFDKDGTLIKFGSLWVRWAQRFVDAIASKTDMNVSGKHELAESLGFHYTDGTWDLQGPLCIGSPDDLMTIGAMILYKKGFPWNEATEIVGGALQEVDESDDWKKTIEPIEGLLNLLKKAAEKSLQLGVVTSDHRENACKHLEQLQIDHYFKSILGDDMVERGKPFPDMVYMSCEEMGIQPERALIIGDSNGDMILGKNSNMLASIGITSEIDNTSTHLKDADHVIEDYDSITL